MRRILWLTFTVLSCGAMAAEEARVHYDVDYSARFEPDRGIAVVAIELRQTHDVMRELDFAAPAPRYRPLSADGELEVTARGFVWRPPATGGTLTYEFVVDRHRGRHMPPRYDARMTSDWALLRADHLFPPARTRTRRGAQSRPTLTLTGPDGWSFETRYGPVTEPVHIDERERGFVRPTGWMVAGHLGIRRERIAGRRVAVAAPADEGYRRIDMLAMLNWNLPYLVELFPEFPDRLLIVGAHDPMWRGGLSGPASLYLHADRPMLSENGTSTLIHELVHVGSRFASVGKDNWIVEGMAEYYSIEIMRRSGTLTQRRFEQALSMLERWGEPVESLRATRASGPIMAAAAVLMHRLDEEIKQETDGKHNLDEVVRQLMPDQRQLSLAVLRAASERVLGHPSAVLTKAFDA